LQGHGVRHLHGARFYALKVAEECGDISTAAHVRVMLAHTHFWRGEFRDGMAAAELAFQALVGSKDGLWIGMSLWILANNTLLLGDLTNTVNAGQRLRTVGESTADRRLQCYAQVILGVATAYRDRSRGAVATAEQALTLAPDPLARSVAELLVGEACLEAEAFEEARGHLRAALETFESAKMPHAWNWAASCLADAELAAKNHQAARELAESVVERTHEAFFPQGRGRALRTLARVNQDDQQLEEAVPLEQPLIVAAGVLTAPIRMMHQRPGAGGGGPAPCRGRPASDRR
jgi:tetratricopeptide (TPR) repeat protein